MELYITAGVALLTGVTLGSFVVRARAKQQTTEAEDKMKSILEEKVRAVESDRQRIALEGKEELFHKKQELEKNFDDERKTLHETSRKLNESAERLAIKQEEILLQERELVLLEKNLISKEQDICVLRTELEQSLGTITTKLEEVASFSQKEAKELLLEETKKRSTVEMAKMIRTMEAEAKEQAKKKAQEIIATAIQRYASDYVCTQTATVLTLPSEDMKGRIIGREGRNIRAIEAATGVDLIIDDTPEILTISSFSPLRRYIAYLAIQRLMQDGRIHPTRIEEIVQKCEEEVNEQIKEFGEKAVFDSGVHGLAPELVQILGSLYFRTSYSQNVLQHSLEVSSIAGMLASELGMNVKLAKRAGLLHDIGKAVDHEIEGPHAIIGADLAKKHGEDSAVVDAIASHHEDIPITSSLAIIIQAADSISGARPGARREILENYIKRLDDLENIANGFEGVVKAFAIQAGREIRVIVDADVVTDDTAFLLSKDIAGKIETNLMYPGQVKVLVIRETRATTIAR